MQPKRVKLFITGACALAAVGAALGVAHLVAEQRRTEDFFAARTAIEENLSSLVFNREVLRMAARTTGGGPGNVALAGCLLGQGDCSVTSAANQVGFTLRTGLSSTDPLIAGTNDSPAIYSATGKLACDKATDDGCPGWQVNVWFWADCPGGAAKCAKAERVHVRQQIRPVGDLAGLSASPPDDRFNSDPTRFNHTVEIGP